MKKALTLLALAGLCSMALAQEVKGNAAEGQKKAAMCVGCHSIIGYQASFPEIHKVPMIAGQNAKYLATALGEYKKGDRKHPTMRSISASLSDQDMADLADYFSTLAGPSTREKSAGVPAAPEKAQALLKAGNCAACHGADFSSPIDPSYPKLAGQHADYLFVAVRSYIVEGNGIRGRSHPVMSGTIKAASGSVGDKEFVAELHDLADYLSKLPGDLKTVPESRFR